MAQEEKEQIELQKAKLQTIAVKVQAVKGSTLIMHRLAPEAVMKITAKEKGKAKKKENRSMDAEYESCFYLNTDGEICMPSGAFMSASLDAITNLNIHKTTFKRSVRFLGDLYPLSYEKINRRVDFPRRSGRTGAPDERHRPEFINWSCDIVIQYDENLINKDTIINVLDQAGFSSGVGDWRPSAPKSSGSHGMFQVVGAEVIA